MLFRRYRLRRSIKNTIEKPYRLSKEQRRELVQYWGKYTNNFTPLWHEFYLQKSGIFDVHFIPDDIMFTEIEPQLNDYLSSHGFDNKCNYEMYFPEVKQPKTLFRKMQGIFHDENWNIISQEEAIQKCIDNGDAVIKSSQEVGYGGGVKFWSDKVDSIEKLKNIIDLLPGDLIAQDIIIQHPDLEKIKSNSVHCIRTITFISEKEVKYICGYFRMGQGLSKTDYSGGCVCSIYPDGKLYPIGYENLTFKQITEHECGIKFADYTIPFYEEIKEKSIELHKKLGDFRWVSWDFSVDPLGNPILIEVNMDYGGIMYHQLGQGPIFGKDTDKMLDAIYNKSN